MKKNNDYIVSSGNLFADLNVSNPEERLAKAELARQVNTLIKQNGLTQMAASKLLQIDQPKISALNKGKLSGFSLERLFRFLNILGQDIAIKVSPKIRTKSKADVTVKVRIAKVRKLPSEKRPTASSNVLSAHARKNK